MLMLANMSSGRGSAPRMAAGLRRELLLWGHRVALRDVGAAGRAAPARPMHEQIGDSDVVLSIGGDGTIHHALCDLVRTQRPVYHVPGGNENLFAREFGMTSEPAAVLGALDRGQVRAVDLGASATGYFAIMASIGPDAGVIHRLHAVRGRATGHAMYLGPTLAECVQPHLPLLTVRIDGVPVVERRHGMVVIANCAQYAARLDPARGADMFDGLLDVVFLPARSTVRALLWAARCCVGEHLGDIGVVRGRGPRW
ncbi:MAG: hypothetical protein IPJ41_08510 [Phycisphaerales bacterium]|nr:hypothetical protein [Phycisphaerales bacterium]